MSSTKIGQDEKRFTHLTEFDGKYFFGRRSPEHARLKPGIYTIARTMGGDLYVEGMSVTTDQLITLPNFVSQRVIDELDGFFAPNVRHRFERRGMIYKRGVLLYGKHGTGKSSIIIKVMEEQIKRDSIIFFCPSPHDLSEFVRTYRTIDPDRRVVAVFEEFEKLLAGYEAGFLSLLDGELQIDNVAYIATTNYINEIPPRIKDRPSRFATVIEVGLPDAATRKLYIESKTFPDENVDIDTWVKGTEGLTIDKIKDLIISVFCIGLPLEEAIKRSKGIFNNEDELEEDDPYNQGYSDDNEELQESLRGSGLFSHIANAHNKRKGYR